MHDLMYIFFASTTDKIKFEPLKFNKMLQLYLKFLTETLNQLKSKATPPTLFQLNLEYQERGFFSLIATIIFALFLNEQEEAGNIELLLGSSEKSKKFRKQLLVNQRFVKTMKHFLPIWDTFGLLDPILL